MERREVYVPMIDLSSMASTRSPRRRDFCAIDLKIGFSPMRLRNIIVIFTLDSIEFTQFSTRQRSKVVTAFDSNVSILQLSNPFGGAGSSPAVVDSFAFALPVHAYMELLLPHR